jgi:hypothetical protein
MNLGTNLGWNDPTETRKYNLAAATFLRLGEHIYHTTCDKPSRPMERQTLLSRYSDTGTVRAVLENIFPKYRYPDFFKSNPRGFDITVRLCLLFRKPSDSITNS